MNKHSYLKYLAPCLIAALLCSAPLRGEEKKPDGGTSSIGIGFVVWYAWWDPFFKRDISTKFTVNEFHAGLKTRPISSFLYGPVLTFTIKSSWTISSLFVYGNGYRPRSSDWAGTPVTPISNYAQATARVAKYDLDISLGYNVHQYVRLFAGCKVQGYTHREKLYDLDVGSMSNHGMQRIGADATNVGPGAGLQVTVPLVESLFLTGGVSGLYMRGSINARADHAYETQLVKIREQERYNIAGFNSVLSLAYVVRVAGLTIAAGGRYQYLKYFEDGFRDSIISGPGFDLVSQYIQQILVSRLRERHYNRKTDQFYGATFSVIYSVDFPNASRG